MFLDQRLVFLREGQHADSDWLTFWLTYDIIVVSIVTHVKINIFCAKDIDVYLAYH